MFKAPRKAVRAGLLAAAHRIAVGGGQRGR